MRAMLPGSRTRHPHGEPMEAAWYLKPKQVSRKKMFPIRAVGLSLVNRSRLGGIAHRAGICFQAIKLVSKI